MDLIRAWGFTYETQSQRKSNDAFFTGLGYWTRANPEQCLLATRGSPRRRAYDVKRLVVEPPAASTTENQTPSEPASSACSTAPISNCSPARPSQAGARKSVSSTAATPQPSVNRHKPRTRITPLDAT